MTKRRSAAPAPKPRPVFTRDRFAAANKISCLSSAGADFQRRSSLCLAPCEAAEGVDGGAGQRGHDSHREVEERERDAGVGRQADLREEEEEGGLADADAGDGDRQEGDDGDDRHVDEVDHRVDFEPQADAKKEDDQHAYHLNRQREEEHAHQDPLALDETAERFDQPQQASADRPLPVRADQAQRPGVAGAAGENQHSRQCPYCQRPDDGCVGEADGRADGRQERHGGDAEQSECAEGAVEHYRGGASGQVAVEAAE